MRKTKGSPFERYAVGIQGQASLLKEENEKLILALKNVRELFAYKAGTRAALMTHIQHMWPADARKHAMVTRDMVAELTKPRRDDDPVPTEEE